MRFLDDIDHTHKDEPSNANKGAPPGRQTRHFVYECTNCGASADRYTLTAKVVKFMTLGRKGRVLRSRTVAWLCERCLGADPDYNAEQYTSTPGMRDLIDKDKP